MADKPAEADEAQAYEANDAEADEADVGADEANEAEANEADYIEKADETEADDADNADEPMRRLVMPRSPRLMRFFVQLQITINLEAGPLGLILPSWRDCES